MYYQLLNTSIIWLLSLLVFDLFLKKETFHRLNRFYLFLTFILGIALPLLPWRQQARLPVANTAAGSLNTSAQEVADVTVPAIPATIQSSSNSLMHLDYSDWLVLLYLTGTAIGTGLLLKDNLHLYLLYRRGRKTIVDKWTIVETSRSHNPFSFGRYIFVCSRSQYSEQQWQILVLHEQQHYNMRHMADLILLQTVCIVCWFHPLVYYYRSRLRLLHEYEVDRSSEADVAVYGRFLLEQTLLNRAPAMTHSFDYSPIKDRIMMLTKQSSAPRMRFKLLLTLPLIAGFALCCAQSRSDLPIEVKGKGLALKGYQIQFTQAEYDTIRVQDPDTHEIKTLMAGKHPRPGQLNGIEVSPYYELSDKPVGSSDLKTMLTKLNLVRYLSKLPDGKYNIHLDNVLVNPEGRIVYFENGGYYKKGTNPLSDENYPKLDKSAATIMDQKISEYLFSGGLTFTPAKSASGSKIPFLADENKFSANFEISNHQLKVTSE